MGSLHPHPEHDDGAVMIGAPLLWWDDGGTRPTWNNSAMNTLLEDIEPSAEWISRALNSSGYGGDFTPQSLWEIDRFFEEQSRDGLAKPGGLLAEGQGQRLFAVGCYMGEVVLRVMGGEWVADDADPEGEINIELKLPDGTRCWPVQRAMKRFKNGAEDGVAVWGMGLGLEVGPPPAQVRKGLLKRLFG